MLNRLLKLSIASVYFLGLRLRRAAGVPYRHIIGLCYHEVTAAQKTRFLHQLAQLKRHTHTVFLDAPLQQSQKPQVAVSFDDGLANLLENALPALQAQHIPTTLFIPSACLGTTPPWLQGTNSTNANEPIMTAAQLQQLSPAHILIGSHSAHHADLSHLPADELWHELSASKADLEQLLARPIRLLAFPYGRYNAQVLEHAAQAGYQRVFAADPVANESDFLRGRTTASPGDWSIEFYLKVHGAYQWLPQAIAFKHRLKKLFRSN